MMTYNSIECYMYATYHNYLIDIGRIDIGKLVEAASRDLMPEEKRIPVVLYEVAHNIQKEIDNESTV